jgi:hypothetical protein
MLRTLIAASALLAAAPAHADTISCAGDGATIVLEVRFDAQRAGGEVTAIRADTEYDTLWTEEAETIAFSAVAYDRIEAGLESPHVGPMTLTVDIVRAFDPEPGDGPETGVVVAGVARVAGVGTMTLVCTGW